MSMSSLMVSKFEEYPKSSDIYYLEIAYPFGYVIFLSSLIYLPLPFLETFSHTVFHRVVPILPFGVHLGARCNNNVSVSNAYLTFPFPASWHVFLLPLIKSFSQNSISQNRCARIGVFFRSWRGWEIFRKVFGGFFESCLQDSFFLADATGIVFC